MSIESRNFNRGQHKKRKKIIFLILLLFLLAFLTKYILDTVIPGNSLNPDTDQEIPSSSDTNTDPETKPQPDDEVPTTPPADSEKPADTIYIPIAGTENYYRGKIVDNPEDILVLVNKMNYLTPETVYDDLVLLPVYAPGRKAEAQMREVAAEAIMEFYHTAKSEAGLEILPTSGYRSYAVQLAIFQRNIESKGSIEKANQTSAFPGQSEHQTGLAIDLSCESVDYKISNAFGDTKESEWTKENAHRFGFIIRYPKDKTEITGYSYEPWHLRYVGKEVAKEIYDRQICFEEYLDEILSFN